MKFLDLKFFLFVLFLSDWNGKYNWKLVLIVGYKIGSWILFGISCEF